MQSLLGRRINTLEWARMHVPGQLPELAAIEGAQCQGWEHTLWHLHVLETSPEVHLDGHHYYHVSLSYADHMPDYHDINMVRKAFMGEDVETLQIWPRKEFYINVHPYCLHLYHCLDDELFGAAFFDHDLVPVEEQQKQKEGA